jgi:hypothetical protein
MILLCLECGVWESVLSQSRVYVVGFAKFAAEVFFLLADLRSPIDVIFRVYVVLGNLFVRIGIGFAFFISAAAVCTDLTFVVNVSQTVFPALNQDARLKRANLTNPGPRLWSWRQMFLPTFVCRVFRLFSISYESLIEPLRNCERTSCKQSRMYSSLVLSWKGQMSSF